MKKAICIFLSLCLVFLSGCSVIFKPKTGLIEISGLDENTSYIAAADFDGRYWLLLSGIFVPRQEGETAKEEAQAEQGENADSEEYEGEEPEGDFYYALNLVNPKSGRLIKSLSLKDCPLKDIFGAKYDDGGILVYDEYNKKCVSYSADLKQAGKTEKYTFTENEALAGKNENTNDSFSTFDSFCYDYTEYYSDTRVNAYAFYGDEKNLYFANGERLSPSSGIDMRVLGTKIKSGEFSSEEIMIYDFSSSLIINSINTPDYGADKSVSLSKSVLKENSAFLSVEEGKSTDEGDEQEEYFNHCYIWNYSLDEKNIPFKSEKLGAEEIEKKNKDICEGIKNSYGIAVHINEANEETKAEDEVYALTLDASAYEVYRTLIGIGSFFKKLPDGFVKETYTGIEHTDSSGFDIFIGGDIVGFPTAYANIWGERFAISLKTRGFNVSTFAHEFMHIIDARLEDFYWDEGLDNKWNEFNPEGFEYLGYQDMGAEGWEDMDFSKFESFFATSYCMSAATEDRADTFASLFDYGTGDYTDSKPYWYKPGTAVAKKAVFLCEAIRKAYPCLKNAGVQPWEKSINSDLAG